jgi:hypothetical protein
VATALLAGSLALMPRASVACAVCFTGKDDGSRLTFIFTTALLTLLPLLLIGGTVWWLRRRFAELDRETELLRAVGRPLAEAPGDS